MTGKPYYRMLGLVQNDTGLRLALGTLTDARQELFRLEGRKAAVAGRAKGLVLETEDEGGLFLCLGNEAGWFVLCRLEER